MKNHVLATLSLGALVLAGCSAESAPPAGNQSPAAQPAPPAAPTAKVEVADRPATPATDAPAPGKVTATATATVQVAAKEVGTAPGKRIPKFTATGTSGGAAATLDSQAAGAVTVYCVGSTECPYTNKYASKLQSIEASYAGKDVKFVWLYPNRAESDADKTAWHEKNKLQGIFVVDREAAITKTLAAARTPEMVVAAADGTITYRGAIDDGGGDPKRAKTEYLRAAIDATLAGKAVEVNETTPAG